MGAFRRYPLPPDPAVLPAARAPWSLPGTARGSPRRRVRRQARGPRRESRPRVGVRAAASSNFGRRGEALRAGAPRPGPGCKGATQKGLFFRFHGQSFLCDKREQTEFVRWEARA